MDYFLAC